MLLLVCSQERPGSDVNTDSADSEGTCESAHRLPPGIPLDGLISHINNSRSLYSQAPPASAASDNICLVGEASGRIRWIQPSGEQHAKAVQLCLHVHCMPRAGCACCVSVMPVTAAGAPRQTC